MLGQTLRRIGLVLDSPCTLKAVGLTIIDKYSQIEIKRRKIMEISAFIYILCLLNYQYWSAAFASIFSYPVYSNKYMKSSS